MVTCFDIGGSYIRQGRILADGSVPEQGRLPTPCRSWSDFVCALASCQGDDKSDPIVISLAGAFDAATGLADVANIPCLHGRRIAADLSVELGCPVQIINDANAFALAEAVDGTGAGKAVVFGIILGTGVGGGLVTNGTLITGHGGMAGEWGHGPVIDPTAGGTISNVPHYQCGCGRTGCVDATCSARGMERLHHSLHGKAASSKNITDNWHNGDVKASQTIEIYTTLLSRSLSMVVNLLGPDVVPVSGGLSSDATLLEEIDRKTGELALVKYDTPLVMRGTFADNGGLHGAGIFARQLFPQAVQ
ncbi:MAG: ROK family protein [Roseibium sp.]